MPSRVWNLVNLFRNSNMEESSLADSSEECRESSSTLTCEPAQTEQSESYFCSQWKESDVVFVVEEKELHLHRQILIMHSPVFKAMLDGHFKEASQQKISLEGKSYDEMVAFFKLLYPSSMMKSSLDQGKILKMLAIADEYQTIDLIKHLLDEAQITPSNALAILPFAVRYNPEVGEKCINTAKTFVETKVLGDNLRNVDAKEMQTILLGKCEILEDIVDKGREYLLRFICNSGTTSCQCYSSHPVSVDNLHGIRGCSLCLRKYQEEFCDHSDNMGQELLQLLLEMDDVLHEMDQRTGKKAVASECTTASSNGLFGSTVASMTGFAFNNSRTSKTYSRKSRR